MKLGSIKNLAVDSVIYGLSGMFIKLIGFILFPLFARKFSAETYGIIGVLNSLNLVLMTLAGLGMEGAATRWFFDSEEHSYKKKIFTTWFSGQFVATLIINLIVFLFFRNWLGNKYLKIEHSSWLISIVLINLFLSIIPSILNTYFILNKKPFYSLLTSVSLIIITGLFSLYFVFYLNWGIFGFYLGQTVGFLVMSAVGVVFYFVKIKVFQFELPTWLAMAKYGLKIIPANLSNQFLLFFAILIMQPLTSQAAIGFFQVAYTLSSCITLFTGGFGQAFVPYALSVNEEEFKSFTINVFDIYCAIMSFICFTIAIFYHELITIFLSPKYLNSEIPAGILTFGNFLISLNAIASITLIKRKKIEIYGRVIFIINFIQILLIWLLTKQFGINGAALSFLISQALSVLSLFYFSQKAIPIPYHFIRNVMIILGFVALYFFTVRYIYSLSDIVINKFILLFLCVGIMYLINLSAIKKTYQLIRNRTTR